MSEKPSWDTILYILAMTVIIDQRVREPELSEFVRQGQGLAEWLGLDMPNETLLKNWYADHEPEILSAIQSKGKNTVVLRALSAIKDETARENIYDAMIAISLSDREFHKIESDLIRSAAAIWGFLPPPLRAGTQLGEER